QLLSDVEQEIFRRLGVFAGGISLDSAGAIVASGDSESELLKHLKALVDQNLLRRETLPNKEPSFRILGTIRDYARERLVQAGELDLIQYRFAIYWRDFAEVADTRLRDATQLV